jgi:hypothetical protein
MMLGKQFVKTLLVLTALLGFSATSATGAEILFVTVDPTDPEDAVIKSFLEGLGHTVTYIDDNEDEATTEEAAAAADLVYISESVSSGQIREEITEIETPMIITEAWAWDEMGLTQGGGGGTDVASTDITIVNPEHYLAANFIGTVQVLTGIGDVEIARFGNGMAGAGAAVIATATLSDEQTYDVLFVYEKGAPLAVAPTDGSPQVAADTRICMFFDEISIPLLNENGYALLAAAVSYALGATDQARNPNPPDKGENINPSLLQWSAGRAASWHNVYFGTNPTPGAAELVGDHQTETTYQPPDGFDPSTTYYWRIDEIEADGTTIHTGPVWSFTTAPLTASNPVPADGSIYLDAGVVLGWISGFGDVTHNIYLGTDEAAVIDAAVSSPEFKANLSDTTYRPTGLAKGQAYYWRIDEVEADGTTTHKGDIWNFSTLPDIPIRDPNLIGWWKLDDEGTGIATDYSGHDNHGTLFGNLQWVPGFDGEGLEFDGASYVDLPTGLAGTDKGTVTVWIKNTMDDRGMIFYTSEGTSGDGFGGQNEFHINMRSGGMVRFFLEGGDAGDINVRTSAVNDDTWHHIAGTWDINGDMMLYVDGGTPVSQPHNGASFDFVGAIRLGSPISNQRYYIGLLDDVRLYDYVLSQEDIAEVMKGDIRLPSDPSPANSSRPDIEHATPLSWSPGENAEKYDVYFGTDRNTVRDADTSDTSGIYRSRQNLGQESYTPPEKLEFGQNYFWRVDQINTDSTVVKGKVWKFTIAEYLIIDDFEGYTNYQPDDIFSTWSDGYNIDENGALVGHDEPDFVETETIHGGKQSMPYFYDNSGTAKYSQASRAVSGSKDWTREGVTELSLWFKGHPAYVGSFTEAPAGTYTITATGVDIWDGSDEFHFAYKQYSGAGAIIAKVESVQNTDPFAKAGVMIRDTLEPDSINTALLITPENGVRFQYRLAAGDVTDREFVEGITAPHWVKLERTIGGLIRAYNSADGITWEQLPMKTVTMNTPIYIGLAVTSHNAELTCEAKFSNVSFPDTNVDSQWTDQDVGITSNYPEPMYVAVSNSNGTPAAVYHDDPDAALIETWTEWTIDLKLFEDQGIDLTDVDRIYLGFGDKNNPQPGGPGTMFYDDIRLYRPRVTP